MCRVILPPHVAYRLRAVIGVTNCDAWTVFSFPLPLFIACTITVGHVTDDLYFRM
jgi:hypothetical protein